VTAPTPPRQEASRPLDAPAPRRLERAPWGEPKVALLRVTIATHEWPAAWWRPGAAASTSVAQQDPGAILAAPAAVVEEGASQPAGAVAEAAGATGTPAAASDSHSSVALEDDGADDGPGRARVAATPPLASPAPDSPADSAEGTGIPNAAVVRLAGTRRRRLEFLSSMAIAIAILLVMRRRTRRRPS
jgi:hypothetical protein